MGVLGGQWVDRWKVVCGTIAGELTAVWLARKRGE